MAIEVEYDIAASYTIRVVKYMPCIFGIRGWVSREKYMEKLFLWLIKLLTNYCADLACHTDNSNFTCNFVKMKLVRVWNLVQLSRITVLSTNITTGHGTRR